MFLVFFMCSLSLKICSGNFSGFWRLEFVESFTDLWFLKVSRDF